MPPRGHGVPGLSLDEEGVIMNSGKTNLVSRLLRVANAILALGLAGLSTPSFGDGAIDMHAVVQETQQMSQGSGDMTLVWWLPEQFWEASMAQNPDVSRAQVDEFVKTVRPYTMIAVVDGQIGAFAGVTYKSDQVIRSTVFLRDAQGESYAPIAESAINPDTRNLLQMLKPVIANMLGPMGENMHFLLFPAVDKQGRPLADPTKAGAFQVAVGEKTFSYRLPLGSVLPPKFDPGTRERFPGNYNFNPYTGGKLTVTPPAGTASPAP